MSEAVDWLLGESPLGSSYNVPDIFNFSASWFIFEIKLFLSKCRASTSAASLLDSKRRGYIRSAIFIFSRNKCRHQLGYGSNREFLVLIFCQNDFSGIQITDQICRGGDFRLSVCVFIDVKIPGFYCFWFRGDKLYYRSFIILRPEYSFFFRIFKK